MATRPIKTKYYVGKRYHDPIHTNSAGNSNLAVAQAILRMQIGYYRDTKRNPATSCEVYDTTYGQLHALITRSPLGDIRISYKRDPEKFEKRLAIGALFDKHRKAKNGKAD